jgi:hypothetical protein
VKTWRLTLALITLALLGAPAKLVSNPGNQVQIRVYGISVDTDTRPDQAGAQYTMTAVRGFPTAIHTLVGAPGHPISDELAAGLRVKATLHGPAYDQEGEPLEALANQPLEIPDLPVEGDYEVTGVRLEDSHGRTIVARNPLLPPVQIHVIDKLLVTQVTSRPLTLEEIREKGIVIDESNFTAVNFTVGLTLGSKQVKIDLPVALPSTKQAMADMEPPKLTSLPSVQSAFDRIDIPNFSLAGFQLTPPPEIEEQEGIELPPINGVIVIPGNIGFLNQFFSVILQATNVAPEGSDLSLRAAQATIRLPVGKDDVSDSGDDPLRVAKVKDKGRQKRLPLERESEPGKSTDSIDPQQTNQAEFLVEGMREGTHRVDFDISGDLYVPALGRTVAMTGAAAGVVQVKNPTFSIGLAHPKVVREGEEYAIFATVTNTSTTPANLFQLGLNTRSLSGARPAEGEEGLRKLETLEPGQAESFEFQLVAETTGEVRGTVFLADEGINGNFLLTTGVGDTGIPLSPDTLVLPDTVSYLPKQPDLLFQAVRLLGQAYSVATAPGGTLPPEIPRVKKGFVFDKAVRLAQAGLHVRFGETPLGAVGSVLMDYLTPGRQGEDASLDERNRHAFDVLRRAADAGHDFSDALGGVLANGLGDTPLAGLQADWAARFAAEQARLSVAAEVEGGSVELRLTDQQGRILGRVDGQKPLDRAIPYAARLPLKTEAVDRGQMLLAPPVDAFDLELAAVEGTRLTISLVLPGEAGLRQVLYPPVDLPKGGNGRLEWRKDAEQLNVVFQRPDDRTLRLRPEKIIPIEDEAPRLLGVSQWAKGARPAVTPTFESGDPLGRMLGILFSETVDRASATDPAAYRVADNQVTGVSLQPDDRLAFVLLDKPVGPFKERKLEVEGVKDRKGHAMGADAATIDEDPERGLGAHFKGRVVTPAGEPIPYATIKYIQPLTYPVMEGGCQGQADVADYVVSNYAADADGRFEIDYVLQAEFPPGCPSNADVWLNKNNPRSSQNFKLQALDPETGEVGTASARVHYDEQRMAFDVIIRGVGSITGRLLEPDGSPMKSGEPGSKESLRVIARNVSTGETYLSWTDAEGRYTFPYRFTNGQGKLFEAPKVAVGNVILHVVRPGDGYSAVTTVNLDRAGRELEQDLVLLAPTAYGSVSGRVLEADGVTPAADVQVQIAGRVLRGVDLYQRSYGQGVIDSAVTDANGAFVFENVPTGDIQVRALRQSTYEMVDAKAFVEEQKSAELAMLFPGSGGAVRGLVRDALGRPVPKAKVAGGPTLTETDPDGQFEIKGLPLGRFKLVAQGPDYPALGQLTIDSLGPGEVQEVVITLEPVGSITGSLYEADGVTPISGQKVQLWLEPDAGVLSETFSLADGQFRFENYPVGDYSLRAVRRSGGDGGMTYVSIRFAGDVQDADLRFRGLGEVRGRVVQSNGSPAVSDVVVSHKVWRVFTQKDDARMKLFLAYIEEIKKQSDEKTAKQIEQAMKEAGLRPPVEEFYMLMDEASPIRSDILDAQDKVTGQFRLPRVLAGPVTVAAFGPFLTPAEVKTEIPRTRDAEKRVADVGDVTLEPATAQVRGTVYLPDGRTPVGPNVVVKLRSLSSAGSVMSARGPIKQPVLPEIDARTDEQGRFHFPLMLRGRFVLTVDTGEPDARVRAKSAEAVRNTRVRDPDGRLVLNTRLYGQAGGVAPAGETVQADLRLHGAGAVRVQVVDHRGKPVPFAHVDLHTASTLDADQESGSFTRQRADKKGQIEFLPVLEGKFSVGARAPKSPARGRAQGEVPENPADGYRVPVMLTLGAVTAPDGKVVEAKGFGTVTGQVLKADGTPLDNPAQVTVRARGIDLLTTTVAEGRFEVADVPEGTFGIEAFEPFTARRGEARGEIGENGQTVELPVQLVGLGRVSGTVTDHSGETPVYGADVVLTPTGIFSGRVVTRSDRAGGYQLPGVPLGTYTVDVKDPESELEGVARGLLKRDGDARTTDVRLAPSGQIRGRVLSADGKQPVANAQVEIRGPKVRAARTGRDGSFDSGPYLMLGDYRVTVQTEKDGVRTVEQLQQDRQILDLDLRLAGLGTVSGVVLDSAGEKPEHKAQVTLHGKSPFFGKDRTLFTGPDGAFRFPEVPVGELGLSVVSTLREPALGARADGVLESAGASLGLEDITLQPSGSIQGRVLMADGKTPAAGTVIAVRGRGVRLGREADEQGLFTFKALPLGEYVVTLRETASNAVASRRAKLEKNGQVESYEPVVLDDADPAIVQLEPGDGGTGVNPRAPVRVVFSEPMAPDSIHRGTFRVTAAGHLVAGEYQLSQDGTEVKFVPRQGLPDLQAIQVVLAGQELGHDGRVRNAGVTDLAGRSLPEDRVLRFTTSDATPPALVKQSPAQDADGLPVKTVVRLEFSEPVDPKSIKQARFTRDGKPEQGQLNSQPILGGKVLVYSPGRPLRPNGKYELILDGPVTDLSGNPMPGKQIRVAFSTIDTRAPRITALTLPKDVQPVSGKRIPLSLSLERTSDLAYVELYRNGQWIHTIKQPPFEYPVYLDPKLGTQISLAAVAVDKSGNRSPQKILPLQVRANRPPRVRIVSPIEGEISVGQTLSLQIAATDDIGIRRLAYTVDGGAAGGLARTLDDPLAIEQGLPVTLPEGHPIGSTVTLQAVVEDRLGETAVSAPVRLAVVDRYPPRIEIQGVTDKTKVEPGALLEVRVQARDAGGVKLVSLAADGIVTRQERHTIEPAQLRVGKSFRIQVPETALGTDALRITARAVDVEGNGDLRQFDLGIHDRVPPKVAFRLTDDRKQGEPGHGVHVAIEANDEMGVTGYQIRLGDEVLQQDSFKLRPDWRNSFWLKLPADLKLDQKVTLTAVVQDAAGNEGKAEDSLTTRDLNQPEIRFLQPEEDHEIPQGGTVLVWASVKDPFGVSRLKASVTREFEEAHECTLELPKNELEAAFAFTVPPDAVPGHDFHIRLEAFDAAGNRAELHSRRLQVLDLVPPNVVEVNPADGATDQEPGLRVRFKFDEPIDGNSLKGDNVQLLGKDGPVAGSVGVEWYTNGQRVLFSPEQPLSMSGEFTLLVQNVSDRFGNLLVEPFRVSFRIKDPDLQGPKLIETRPAAGAEGVSLQPEIEVMFDEKVSWRDLKEDFFSLIDEQGEVVAMNRYGYDDNTRFRLRLEHRLKPGRKYRIRLLPGATDEAGNPITGPDGKPFEQWFGEFTTGALEVIRPARGEAVAEGGRVLLKFRPSEGMEPEQITVQANGRPLNPARAPEFETHALAPMLADADTLELRMAALDENNREIARGRAAIGLKPALRFETGVLGLQPGGQSVVELGVGAPLDQDLRVKFSTAGGGIVSLADDEAVLRAGSRSIGVELRGLRTGNAFVVASSALGDAVAVVSVAEAAPGPVTVLAATDLGVAVDGTLDQAPYSSTPIRLAVVEPRPEGRLQETGALRLAVAPGVGLPTLTLPRAGAYRIMLASPGPIAGHPVLLSSDAAVARPLTLEAASQDGFWVLEIEAPGAGEAVLRVATDQQALRLPVRVGLDRLTPSGVVTQPIRLGAAVDARQMQVWQAAPGVLAVQSLPSRQSTTHAAAVSVEFAGGVGGQ